MSTEEENLFAPVFHVYSAACMRGTRASVIAGLCEVNHVDCGQGCCVPVSTRISNMQGGLCALN